MSAVIQASVPSHGVDAKKVTTSEVSPAPSSIFPGSTEPGDGHDALSDLSEADSGSEAGLDEAHLEEDEKEVVSVEHWIIVSKRLASVFRSELKVGE